MTKMKSVNVWDCDVVESKVLLGMTLFRTLTGCIFIISYWTPFCHQHPNSTFSRVDGWNYTKYLLLFIIFLYNALLIMWNKLKNIIYNNRYLLLEYYMTQSKCRTFFGTRIEPIIDYLLGSEEPTQIHKNKRTRIALTPFHIFYVGTIWDG